MGSGSGGALLGRAHPQNQAATPACAPLAAPLPAAGVRPSDPRPRLRSRGPGTGGAERSRARAPVRRDVARTAGRGAQPAQPRPPLAAPCAPVSPEPRPRCSSAWCRGATRASLAPGTAAPLEPQRPRRRGAGAGPALHPAKAAQPPGAVLRALDREGAPGASAREPSSPPRPQPCRAGAPRRFASASALSTRHRGRGPGVSRRGRWPAGGREPLVAAGPRWGLPRGAVRSWGRGQCPEQGGRRAACGAHHPRPHRASRSCPFLLGTRPAQPVHWARGGSPGRPAGGTSLPHRGPCGVPALELGPHRRADL